ncbi:MAG: alkaline phosphatase [Propioniciclava sp.]|uniref:alkaline phosphatase n=1 Tax=Propioniciclava sp. TaxID=2038686 RepID=UPI0039E6D542
MQPSIRPRVRAAVCVGLAAGITLAPVLTTTASAEEVTTPKNIILLISDGAGYNQFDAGRLYDSGTTYQQVVVNPATGAIEHVPGTPSQVYDSWDVQVAESHFSRTTIDAGRTYSSDAAWGAFDWAKDSPTDSAAAGTALGTGVKTYNGVLGFDAKTDGTKLTTVGERAMAVGKKVGLVTSVPFSHATPAGFIAHNTDRWDNTGIANEMIDSGVDVIIGGGHPNFDDDNRSRPAYFEDDAWIGKDDFERVAGGKTPFTFIDSKAQFEAVASGANVPDKLFGLARVAETFQYNRAGLETNNNVAPFSDPQNADVPSLVTSTKAALNVLKQDEDGFFLMVEGGAVDWAGHANQTTRLVEEQYDFNRSVEAAVDWVEKNSSWDETLIMVTADHETGFLSGPGAGSDTGWTALIGAKGELPSVSWHSGNHTNQLVPFFAHGAGSATLNARATGWDKVRGAYLDNTDVGKTIFDLLGTPASEGNAISIEATLAPAARGELSLSVGHDGGVVALSGTGRALSGALPSVTVADTRSDAQSQGKGWTLSGSATDFVAGNHTRTIEAANLTWTPSIASSDGGAAAGTVTTLSKPATLASSDRVTRVGTTVAAAGLDLAVPADAESGRYGSTITLTLFAQD